MRTKQFFRKLNPHTALILRKLYGKLIAELMIPNFYRRKINRVKKKLKKSQDNPSWLSWNELEDLQKKYHYINAFVYDEKNLKHRGFYRAIDLVNMTRKENRRVNTYLELACGNGLVCYALEKLGKKATGIDIVDEFNEHVLKQGIKLIKMDASDLKFKDETFDFVYSFDAFEHVLNPEKVLKEALRVVKKNGYIFISFGLFYSSPWGPHAYRTLTFPYWQFLFPMDLIDKFIKKKNLEPMQETTFNKWSIEDFRNLWKKYSNRLKIINYKEIKDIRYLNLIARYPSCFKSKIKSFDELIVSSSEIFFKKIN